MGEYSIFTSDRDRRAAQATRALANSYSSGVHAGIPTRAQAMARKKAAAMPPWANANGARAERIMALARERTQAMARARAVAEARAKAGAQFREARSTGGRFTASGSRRR